MIAAQTLSITHRNSSAVNASNQLQEAPSDWSDERSVNLAMTAHEEMTRIHDKHDRRAKNPFSTLR